MSGINRNENPARDAARRQVKADARRSCLSSLLSMVLCMVMFFGTSYAYFSDSVSNQGNVIQVGSLQMDLQLKEGGDFISLRQNPEKKVFSQADSWAPGTLILRTLKVTNDGSLPFVYGLWLNLEADNSAPIPPAAQYFEVYVRPGEQNDPITIAQIRNKDDGWARICVAEPGENATPKADTTLADILGKGATLFHDRLGKGQDKTYTIALYLNDDYPSLNDQQIKFSVRLTADQIPDSSTTTPATGTEGGENP